MGKGKWLIIVTLSLYKLALCQSAIVPVNGIPTKEVYDLLLDKKGFVWVAHELGITRISGNNLTSFSNPRQASLSLTNLLEDSYGRIWCHNFSGQIFYVENNEMKLLTAYDNTKEREFPNMVLCNNELIVTSSQGLFICNTTNLNCHYIKHTLYRNAKYLTKVNDKVFLYDGKNWFIYQKTKGIEQLQTEGNIINDENYKLPALANNDTILLIHNQIGNIQKLVYEHNKIILKGEQFIEGLFNSVSNNQGEFWIHTKTKSFTLTKPYKEIKDGNVTCILTDKQGNTWYSSLNMGVTISYKSTAWKAISTNWLNNGDIINKIINYNGQIFCGTQLGKIYSVDSNFTNCRLKLTAPVSTGGIEFMKVLNNKIIIATTQSNNFFDIKQNQLIKLGSSGINDADYYNGCLFIANAPALYISPDNHEIRSSYKINRISIWIDSMLKTYPSFSLFKKTHFDVMIGRRCRAVRVEQETGTIAAAFIDGLVEIDHNGIHPVTYHRLPVYANSLEYYNGKLFIATPANGILIKDENGIKNIEASDNGLYSNVIIKIKAIGSHLWVFEDNSMQVLDLNTEHVISQIELPDIDGANVYDITEAGPNAYLSSKEGLFEIPVSASFHNPVPSCYLDYALVNDRDTLEKNDQKLAYNQNNIQFFLSSPWYSKTSTISFKYRLSGANEEWRTLSKNDWIVRYISLMPGNYTFEAYAELNNGEKSRKLIYHFLIKKPWWQEWWFYSGISLSAILLIFSLYQYRLKQILRVDRIRRKLSSDLHDDIGATLSVVNIYSELAKEEKDNIEYLEQIQIHANDVIEKLRDLVWTINPLNDSVEKLIDRIQSFATQLFNASGIHYTFNYDEKICQLNLPIHIKQNLFLVLKELINNIAKHSHAENCSISLNHHQKRLVVLVKDNGKGFNTDNQTEKGNGLKNIKERVQEMKGTVTLNSSIGSGTSITISVPV